MAAKYSIGLVFSKKDTFLGAIFEFIIEGNFSK